MYLFRCLILLSIFATSVLTLPARHHWVSPAGGPAGSGSLRDPWDIQTALRHPPSVEPGDVIWLLGGRYGLEETLVSTLQGAEGRPIVVRQWPGRRATFDCRPVASVEPGADCLKLESRHTWYWGFEVMNSSPVRWTGTAGSSVSPRGRGIHSQAGEGTKLINLVIHDVGTALFESQRSGIEITGNIVYNGGWDAPDRSHGLGFYIRNRGSAPTKTLRDNIIFQQYRQGIQGFGSFRNVFSNFLVEGNVLFNNGIGLDDFHRNFMFGNDNTEHVNNTFRENYTYYSWGWERGSNMFASNEGGCRGLRLLGNVFSHGPGRVAADINNCTGVLIEDNFFFGSTFFRPLGSAEDLAGERFQVRFPENEYFGEIGGHPSGVLSFVRSNPYEPQRAHIIIYNWDRLASVEVDLKGLPVRIGQRYRLRSVQDYFGKAIQGVYWGRPLRIPMTGWEPAQPIGHDRALPPTLPEFGVFVLTWGESPPNRPFRSQRRSRRRP